MFQHLHRLRVRYGETDQMGFVYHGNYATYFEVARSEAIRQLGFSYKEMEDHGVHMPVIELCMNYKRPARYDDELFITTSVKQLPGVRIQFDYEIYNQKEELLTTGHAVLVYMNSEKNRPTHCPEFILDKLKPFFTT